MGGERGKALLPGGLRATGPFHMGGRRGEVALIKTKMS